jgi:hypothetical protein
MEPNNKEILINKDCHLIDIQSVFTANYPFLRIEFIQLEKDVKSLKRTMIDPLTSLKQLKFVDAPIKIDINNNRTVSEVSDDLEKTLRVIVQVSRKSGNVWNMISVTDNWTLQSQNTAGEYICSEMAVPVANK